MATHPEDLISLTELPRELRKVAEPLEVDASALTRVKYQALYGRVLDGVLPAERVGSRWFVRRKDLSAILVLLGLISPKAPRASRQRRQPSNAAVAA